MLTLSHEEYYDELLERFNMLDCNSMPTPAETGTVYSKIDISASEEDILFMKDKPYSNLACSLLYPANISRPDTTWACNTACKFLQNPGVHWQLVQRITRYIKGTKHLFLIYNGNLPMIVTSFADATWADDVDDRKSTGGYLFFIGSSLISWSSKKQKSVSLSTNNAEFAALSEACREGRFIRGLLFELSPATLPPHIPIYIFEDNEGAINQANSNILNNANRTIALKFHHVREELIHGRIKLLSISSQEQIADGLTKALPPGQFLQHRARILGMDIAWWNSILRMLPNGLSQTTSNARNDLSTCQPEEEGAIRWRPTRENLPPSVDDLDLFWSNRPMIALHWNHNSDLWVWHHSECNVNITFNFPPSAHVIRAYYSPSIAHQRANCVICKDWDLGTKYDYNEYFINKHD